MRNLEAVLNKAADLSDKLANTVRALDKTAKAADLIGFVLPSGQAMKAVRMTLAGGSGKVRALWAGVTSFFGGGGAKTISTGRTVPNSLREKLAMEEVMRNPMGTTPPRIPPMSDTKNNLLAADGWVKRVQNVRGVEIHYVENIHTKKKLDFKFVD
jgi:hypothetical protein